MNIGITSFIIPYVGKGGGNRIHGFSSASVNIQQAAMFNRVSGSQRLRVLKAGGTYETEDEKGGSIPRILLPKILF